MTDEFTKKVRKLGELCRFGWERLLKVVQASDSEEFVHLVCHANI